MPNTKYQRNKEMYSQFNIDPKYSFSILSCLYFIWLPILQLSNTEIKKFRKRGTKNTLEYWNVKRICSKTVFTKLKTIKDDSYLLY